MEGFKGWVYWYICGARQKEKALSSTTEAVQTVRHPCQPQLEVELPTKVNEPEKLGTVDSHQITISEAKGSLNHPAVSLHSMTSKGGVQYFIGVQLDGSDHVEPLRIRLSEQTELQSAKLVEATTENVDGAVRELPDPNLVRFDGTQNWLTTW
ncbi:Phototropin [Carex littledalei]|uniref:Phototropin n=1 Tax=Carex littledalei TaxID=544730 RepID=A0A833W2S5_9POAL|nr:Phototropin [Carex littledalei]